MRSVRGTTQSRAGRRPARLLTAGALGAALMLTAACSSGGDDDGEAEEPGDAPAAEEEVTIRFSWWGNEDRAAITTAAVDEFMAENPNITVETEYADFEAYFDRLSTSVAANDEPDVITMGGAYPREYGARGVLLDLATLEEHLDLESLDEGAVSNGFFEDTQFGVPTGVNTYGLIYNPSLFEQAGVEVPDDDTWDWPDFVALTAELQAALPAGSYALADPTVAETMDLYTNQMTGQGMYTADGELNLNAEVSAEWWEMTTGLMEAGATPEASLTVELSAQGAPEQSLLGQGKAAMAFGWSNMLGAYSAPAGTDLAMLRPPGETNHEGPAMWLQASQLYTISARTEHPEASAKLVNFLVTSTAAADHIGADRGIPANTEVRQHLIDQGLEPIRETEFAFIDRVGSLIDGDFVVGPTGSTETADIIKRLNESVLFGQISPADAADQLVAEVQAAIS